jgi:hypothetical protein
VTYRRGLALAFVLCGVACGKSGGSGELPQYGPEDPSFNPERPVNSTDEPSNDYDGTPTNTEQPAFSDDAPPGGGLSPGGGGSEQEICEEICSRFIAAGCVEEQPGECLAECGTYGTCEDEIYALFYCILESPNFACVDGEIDESVFEYCPNEAQAFARCLDETEPPDPEPDPDPQPGCTLADSCGGCPDVCSACLCAFENDTASCVDYCG